MRPTSSISTLSLLALFTALAPACKTDDTADDEIGETGSETGTSETETSDTGETTDTGNMVEEPAPLVDWPTLECDSLVPEYCMYPFPNNVFTAADPSTVTGRRLALVDASLPVHEDGQITEAAPFDVADGFSPGQALLAYLPRASSVGLPTWQDLDASLAADSPTILLDAETGERIPHFSEIDISTAQADGSLLIRPVERLKDGTRYIVAIRDVQNLDGELIPASPDFAVLRDLLPTEDATLDARRPLYADIFMRLEQAGVERASLQLAWDYTTASAENNTGALLHMRDEALAMYGEGMGPTYQITDVDSNWETQDIAFKIEGLIEVPLYLDQPGAGGRLQYGDDGLPEPNGTAQYEFIVLIPNSALEQPAQLLQYGHGLLGSASELQTGHVRSFINEHNYIVFGLDWVGMAESDAIYIANMLNTGAMHDFEGVTDRLQQGLLNFVLGARMMKTSFADDPSYGQYIDPSAVHYWGISQGGIFGGAYMAITPDIERGCVEVPGQPYNMLLNRSVDFDQYFALLTSGYDDSRDVQMLLGLIQLLWDKAEPNGYSYRIQNDLFPDTIDHEVLIRAAVGDHQVTTLGAHIMARAVDVPLLDTGIREVWGLDTVMDSHAGSTYVEFDFGLPEIPLQNIPFDECDDPHGKLRSLPEAREQLDTFLQTGVVENTCTNGVCSFPELSGC
ncbi:hypothetical protein ACNOYE_29625 [Nannocystaceae bacterium ST9]